MLSPGLHIKMFNKKIRSFHFFGVIGFILGMALGISLCYFLHLKIGVILLMALTGAAAFFLLAFVAKIITGEETIVYYHHEIAILILCSIALKLMNYPQLPYIDVTLLGIGTFLAFGRIGCFNVGCCHGRPGSFGYHYGAHHVEEGFTWYYKNVRLLPVQLIESVFVFSIVITGSFILFQHVLPGTVLILYTVVYGSFRFTIEFFRGDTERPYYKGLSEAQWTTLLLVTITLFLSYSGSLPLYTWHVVLFVMLCTASLYIIFFKRKTNGYRLATPRHIREIASGLRHAELRKNDLPDSEDPNVNVYTTSEGLSFSSGVYYTAGDKFVHYTLSGNSHLTLNKETAYKLGKIIGLIRKHSGAFEIIGKDNNIYHVIFKEKKINEQLKVEMPDESYPEIFYS